MTIIYDATDLTIELLDPGEEGVTPRHERVTWHTSGMIMPAIDTPELIREVVYPPAIDSLIAAARDGVLPRIAADELKDGDALKYAGLFPDWAVGIAVLVGEVYRWDGTLVEVIQAHTTQADWTPDVVPALFKIHRTPDMVDWTANVSYVINDEVNYNGTTYRCLQSHTSLVGWEPPNVPALWTPV